jgi:hypothetical protein
LIVLKELIESGRITLVSDRTYPLSEVPEAIEYLEQGHDRENVVITVKGEPERSIHRCAWKERSPTFIFSIL